MTRAIIQPATVRDLTYIAANMRPVDKAEIDCQFPYWTPTWLGAVCQGSEYKWCAIWDGEPIAALGFAHQTAVVVQGWSWGTSRYPQAVRAMMRFVVEAEAQLREGGVRRIEVRALKSHTDANRLIARMGGKAIAKLRNHGTDGETFVLYERVL
jgi:RimJ/RimL family protein N-acetyltransferase